MCLSLVNFSWSLRLRWLTFIFFTPKTSLIMEHVWKRPQKWFSFIKADTGRCKTHRDRNVTCLFQPQLIFKWEMIFTWVLPHFKSQPCALLLPFVETTVDSLSQFPYLYLFLENVFTLNENITKGFLTITSKSYTLKCNDISLSLFLQETVNENVKSELLFLHFSLRSWSEERQN